VFEEPVERAGSDAAERVYAETPARLQLDPVDPPDLERPSRVVVGSFGKQHARRMHASQPSPEAAAPPPELETPLTEFEFAELPGLSDDSPHRPSFSIAAAVTAGALLVAATIAVIAVFSILHRRGPARAPEAAPPPAAANQPEVFVPTPVAALDYAAATGDRATAPAVDITSAITGTVGRPENDPTGKRVEEPGRTDRNPIAGRPVERDSATATPGRVAAPPPRVPETDSSPAVRPAPGRLNWDSVSSHLVQSRSVRTPRGLHYELTFNLQDQTGRQSYLKGLTIQTRSRSGATRTQAIPFSHRLGANGSLTFTVGVDMPGSGAADWGGHMSLLVTGTDGTGNPVQSRFGVPLAP
jgi:hypothetical protein